MKMKKIPSFLRFLGAVYTVNFRSALEYRTNFFLQLFGMMLNNASFALFWLALLDRTGPLGGYGFREVMFLWSLGPASFGLAHIFCGNIARLSTLIQNGDLDVYLLQPRNPHLHVLISRSDTSAWGDLLYGLLVMAFLAPDPQGWALFLILCLSGGVIFTASYSLVHSLTFWWGGASGLFRAFQEFILSFSLYPETIFPGPMKWVLYSLVPAGFLAFLPLEAFRTQNLSLVPLIVAAAAGYAALSAWVFRAGLRRYESGNLVGSRL